jgi:PIN domain nuclease of toxin-antitoxin system
MRILFDSHALVWFLTGDHRFPSHLRGSVGEAEKFISAVCVWEMATKVSRGKWPEANRIAVILDDVLETSDYTALPISLKHAQVAGYFASRHRDPFDRMLAAQAQVEAIPLLTADPVFGDFGVHVIW